jgi:hypothetical protein
LAMSSPDVGSRNHTKHASLRKSRDEWSRHPCV